MTPDIADALADVLIAAEDWLNAISQPPGNDRDDAMMISRNALVNAIDELMSAIEFSDRERPGRHMSGDGGER